MLLDLGEDESRSGLRSQTAQMNGLIDNPIDLFAEDKGNMDMNDAFTIITTSECASPSSLPVSVHHDDY